jgi:hypothetical protein
MVAVAMGAASAQADGFAVTCLRNIPPRIIAARKNGASTTRLNGARSRIDPPPIEANVAASEISIR